MRELSLHVLDLIENSLEAGATEISIGVNEDQKADTLRIEVADNGRGMSAETVLRLKDPFFTSRTTRRVGLGIPLLAAAAERCGGSLEIESRPGLGTRVRAAFRHSHIDRAPMGDMPGTLLSALLHQPPVTVHYSHRVDDDTFDFNSAEMAKELEGVPFSHPAVLRWLREYLAEGFANLYGGTTNAESAVDRGAAPS